MGVDYLKAFDLSSDSEPLENCTMGIGFTIGVWRDGLMNVAALERAYRRAKQRAVESGYSLRAVIEIQPYSRELLAYVRREYPAEKL